MAEKKIAHRRRLDFSKIPATIKIPNLIEVQKRSYERFLQMDKLPSERDDAGLQSVDVLGFVDQKPYTERLESARAATGIREAAVWGAHADKHTPRGADGARVAQIVGQGRADF